VLVAFSVTPLGTGEAVGEVVAEAVRVVRDSGLPNQTDAMFTTIEGDWDETMAVVKRAVDAVAARAKAERKPERRQPFVHGEGEEVGHDLTIGDEEGRRDYCRSVATVMCGQLSPLKFSRTVCAYCNW